MYQSQHDQTNKMAQAQTGQGIRLVWSDSFSFVFNTKKQTTQSIYSIPITCMLLSANIIT